MRKFHLAILVEKDQQKHFGFFANHKKMQVQQSRKRFINPPSKFRSQITHIPLVPSSVAGGLKGELYLSGKNVLRQYKELKLNHIISMNDVEQIHVDEYQVKHELHPVDDLNNEPAKRKLAEILDSVVDSIHQSLQAGNKVCVHCACGVSRSATVVAAYLAKYHNQLDPITYLRLYRPVVDPNPSFIALLKDRHPSLVDTKFINW